MKRFTSVLRSKRRKSSCGFGSDVEVASSHGTASTATEQRFYRSSASSQASSLGATSSASRSAPAKKHSRTPSALSTSPQEELKPLNTATAATSSLATIGTATSSEADGFGSPGSVISSPPKMRSMETSETTQTSLKFSTSKNSGHERSNISTTAQNYVGFANFPNQVFRRAIRNGFEFTLMVVGRSGLGKSTFMNTLFLAEVNDPKAVVVPPTGSTVKIDQKTVRLVENGVSLNLTLVDTPGFGGAIDNSKCWEPIQQFVDARYLEYLCEESKLERAGRVPDKCVHLCLYFIAPSGHGLDVIDVEFMKRLHDRVNIVPVIAKADTMTKDEIKRFKQQVLRDLDTHAIKVYKFPEPEDPEERRLIEPMRARVPFAVVGSNCVREETGGRKTRYREYPWGTVEVENMDHNDFMALRDMVIRTNMIDLIDVTHDVHYENFRVRQMGASVPKGKEDRDPFTAMEDERFQREKEIAEKKKNLDKVFDEKVREREQKIKGRTSKIEMREDEIARILEHKKAELDQLRNMVSELRRGNLHDSKTSVFSGNENAAGKTSPGEKVKKKTGTLGLFTRN